MPVGDYTLNGREFMLARGTLKGRAWSRDGAPATTDQRSDVDAQYGNLPGTVEHVAVYNDFSGGYGYAYRRPAHSRAVHWSENFDLRFPNQAVHCQQLQALPARYASTNTNCEYLIDVPLPGVNTPPVGAGAVLAMGKGYIASYVPTNLSTVGSMFDRVFEASGGGAITFGRRAAVFGSYTYIGNLDGSGFYRRGHDGTTYTIGPSQPAQVILNSGDRLSFFWKGSNGAHLRAVAQGLDPMTTGNYSATLPIGPGHLAPMDAVDRDHQIFVGMANGLHAGDLSATFVNVLPDLADQQHPDNARDLCVFNGEIQVPHVAGEWSFLPSTYVAQSREVGPANRGDRSPIHGRLRCNTALGPWVYSGLWTGSASYVLAGRDNSAGGRDWTVMQKLPALAQIHRIHFDGVTAASSGQEIPQRMWIATFASLSSGTTSLYVTPIPRGNDNPLAIDPTFTSPTYCGSARIDLGRDNWGAPNTPKIYRSVEVRADLFLSGVRYADVFYTVDGGSRTYLGRAQTSPRSTLWFQGLNGNFVTGQDIELSIESYTASYNMAPVYYEVLVRGAIRPTVVDQITAVTRIADGIRDRNGQQLRPGAAMLSELQSWSATVNPVRLQDIVGMESWVLVQPGISQQETYQEGSDAPEILATVKLAVLDFTANQLATWDQIGTRTWTTISNYTWAQVLNLPG